MSDAQTYECPACGQRITTHVPLTTNPTCVKHTGGGRVMKPVNPKQGEHK